MTDHDDVDWEWSIASGTPKPAWDDLPRGLQNRIEQAVGKVRATATQRGGFTPSLAVRARLSRGRQVFVKAADGIAHPEAAAMHRAEAEFLSQLDEIPEVPRLLASFEHLGWVVLLLEDIEGRHPQVPWDARDLRLVIASLERLSERLTPSPITAPPITERFGEEFTGWRQLRDAGWTPRPDDPFAAASVARMAEIEEQWPEAAAGETLLHADLRADQLLIMDEARLRVVDWPWACIGAAWIDPLFLFPSVRLQGGPPLGDLLGSCELTLDAPPEHLVPVAVALAGYFMQKSMLPDPPGLPTIRRFQRAQAEVLVEWIDVAFAP